MVVLALVVASLLVPTVADAATKPSKPSKPSTSRHRIDCQAYVSPARVAKLPAKQRRQVRQRGAYWVPARKAKRGVKARPGHWVCVRSTKQVQALGRLTKQLGQPSTKGLTRQVVSFPKTLDKSLVITLPKGSEAGWKMRGVGPIAAQSFDRGVVYSTGEFDVVQRLCVGNIKESIAVHARQGTKTWSWTLEWEGGLKPRLLADGSVQYGHHVEIAPPFVTNDAGRKLRDLEWKLSGSTLSLTLNDKSLPLPYVIDPAASYPQRIYPHPGLSSGSTVLENLANTSGAADITSGTPATLTGDYFFWSGTLNGHRFGSVNTITDGAAPDPQVISGVGPCTTTANCNGALGWVQGSFGGTTLNAGPYTVSARIQYAASGITSPAAVGALKARLWKVKLDPSETDLRDGSAVPITGWSNGASDNWGTSANAYRTLTTTLTPVSLAARQLAPDERIYLEMALTISTAGRAGSIFKVATNDASTFVDFGGAASNTPGTAANLRVASAPLNGSGWTSDSTPTLRANLDDPDYLHHVEYQVCSDAACSTVVRTGTSAANQSIGSTNDDWTVPTALPDGTYYVRARTVEDGGDAQAGAWTAVTGTTCTAVGVGPCGRFGVDTTNPTVTFTTPAGSLNHGTVSLGGAASDATSGVTSHGLSWARTAPTTTGSMTTGVSCGGASSPSWACTWNTTSLVDGTYDVTVTVTDGAGHTSSTTRSIMIDNSAPSWPGAAATRDGATAGSDATWTTSTTTLGANWDAATDNSGAIALYEYCFSTLPNCGGTVAASWTSNATTLLLSRGGLSLADGSIYYACVRASDAYGNVSGSLCSDGQTVDATAPTAPTAVNDGLVVDADWTTSSTTLASSWSGGGDPGGSGIDRRETCISTLANCAGTILEPWTSNGLATSRTASALTLVDGQQYFTCVRAFDQAGNASLAGGSCSNGIRVDTTRPSAPATVGDGLSGDTDTIATASSFSANWSSVTDPPPGVGIASGVARYEYCISTSATGSDCSSGAVVTFTDASPATATTFTRTGLSLTDGVDYYACIRANDLAGNQSASVTCSDGAQVDHLPPTGAWATWTESSDYLHASIGSNLLWFNPAAPNVPGTIATAVVTATDAGGMDRVDFPSLAAGPAWGAGGSDTSVGAGDTWSHDYTFTGGGAIGTPGSNHATAYDLAGLSTTSPGALDFQVLPDAAGPAGASLTALSGLQATTVASQSIAVGNDASSGVARWYMDRQFAPLVDGTCGTWDPWVDGQLYAGFNGAAVNGDTSTITHYLNDPGQDGVPDWADSFCFRTRLTVVDQVGNTTTITPAGHLEADFADPTVSVSSPADGSDQGSLVAITGTADDHWAGGGAEYTDTGSGLDRVTVTYAGPASGTACGPITAFTGPWTSHGWTCSWNTGALADGTYTVTVTARDHAGRTSTPNVFTVRLDQGAPVTSFHSFREVSDPHGAIFAAGGIAWVRPTAPLGSYQLDARFVASDAGSGIAHLDVPTLGAGWTPAATSQAAAGTTSPVLADGYTQAFTFLDPSALAAPGTTVATAFDGAGNSTPASFEVRLDSSAPSGQATGVTNGRQGTPAVTVPLTAGGDGALGSGVAQWTVEYDTAPLADDTCGTWSGSWSVASTGVGSAPASISHDVSVLGSACYRYRLLETDNVGNVGSSGTPATARRVDLVAPTATIAAPLAGTSGSGSVPVSGSATDVHSGIDHVGVTWTGPSATSGTICDPATLGGSGATRTWSCTWPSALLTDGPYTITTTAYDLAGTPSATTSVNVILDNYPPFVAFHSFVESSPYTWWGGTVGADDELFFNPAAVGIQSIAVHVTSSDLGTGVDRVEFEGAGTGWTPGGSVGVQSTPAGPSDRYVQTYTFDPSVPGLADPGSLDATAFDPAGNPNAVAFRLTADATPPATATVSATAGFAASTSIPVTFDTGDDGSGSGVASWRLLRATGTLGGTTCSAWTGYVTVVSSGTGETNGSRTDTIADPSCARYRIEVTDNVGNVAIVDGGQEVMLDLTPPTGAVTLAEGTNPAWQFLDTPQRLYVNANAGRSGTFTADVTAAAASGVLDVAFPALGSGVTGNATVPGPGPAFGTTYSWSAGATPTASPQATVRSNSLISLGLPFEVIADNAPATGATVTHASGYLPSTNLSVAYTVGTDAGSGIAAWQLQREAGTLANGSCTWSGSWTNVGGASGPLTANEDGVIAHAQCLRYRVETTDNVGNVGTSTPSLPAMYDATPPTATHSFVGIGPATGTANGPGGIVYFRPDMGTIGSPTSVGIRIHVTDAESGIGPFAWNAFPGNWGLGTATVNADGETMPFQRWNLAAQPAASPTVATISNGAGALVGYDIPGFEADPSVSSASNWSIGYAHGYDSFGSATVTWTDDQSDDLSGFASWELLRRDYTYASGLGRCDHSSWTDTSLGSPAGNTTTDTTLVNGHCYRYFLRVTDAVGNTADIWDTGSGTPALFDTAWVDWDIATVAEVNDVTPPTAFNLTLPTNPALPAITTAAAAPSCAAMPTYGTSTPAIAWTASSDSETGLAGYDVHVDGAGSPTASVGAGATSWTSGALADGLHSVGVRASDLRANTTDAGPAFPSSFHVDATAPTATLASPTGAAWGVDTTPTLSWTAADGTCLARVEVYVDDLVTPAAVASGTETSWTPAGALAEGTHTWRVEAVDAAGHRTSSSTSTFQVDSTPPAAFALTAPTASQTVRGFVAVAWNASSDAGSGLAALTAYEVHVDGAPATTVGAGVTTATISSLAAGPHTVLVRAMDAVGNTTDTASVSFTSFGPIPAPVLVSPADGAWLNAVPTLDWNWPSDGGPAPTDYDVIVDSVVDGTETHPVTARTIADPGNGTHTWQVEQHDPYTGTVASTTRTFTIDRTNPVNPGPISRAGSIASWPATSDPAAPVASGIDHLEFVIDDGVNPITTVPLAAGTTSYDFGALPDGVYSMTLRAIDRAGNSTTTPVYSVTYDSVPPTPFTLDAPAALGALPAITDGSTAPSCESQPTYVTATPTLSWQASSDATSGLAGYAVYVDGVLVGATPPGTTSLVVPSALGAGAHTWHVVASDNFGWTRSSTPMPMNVRVDVAAPTITLGAPTNASATIDNTPTLSWTSADDNCAARVELTVDAAVVGTFAASVSNYTPATSLADGAHSWSVRVFDAKGTVTGSATRTFTVDTTAPTGITAVTPTNGGSIPEQMLTFDWSNGSDAGTGIDHYAITVDGSVLASSLTASTHGPLAIYAGAHTWNIRAYDAVGNWADFPFTFTATVVPDVTAPNAFDLLTPADASTIPSGTELTWQPSWDFKGVTRYTVWIDGKRAGTTAGNDTGFSVSAGVGAAIGDSDFDGSSYFGSPTYANGAAAGSTTTLGAASSDWGVHAYAGWNAGGSAMGAGDPTVTPVTSPSAGYDGDRTWTAVQYGTHIPASGGDIRFEHSYRFHQEGSSAYDGGTVELRIDDEGNGFGDDTWESTCSYGASSEYGVGFLCDHEVVVVDGGYNAGFSSFAGSPIAHREGFSGTASGVQTKLRMSEFAGMDVQIRFLIAMDGCHTSMPAGELVYCPDSANVKPAVWYIDDLTLAEPELPAGAHTWRVQAEDAAGNKTWSNQTWNFTLTP